MMRMGSNPILTPRDVAATHDGLEVFCTFNPAAARFGDEILLLVRVGEKPLDEPGFVSTVIYDAAAGVIRIVRIPKDDPDLDASDPRKYRYKGRALLTSMSHLRVARSRDGEHFRFDPNPAIFPATPYEAFGCEDARITRIGEVYYVTYTAVSEMGVTVALATTRDFVRFERLGVIFPPHNKDVCIFPETIDGRYVCRHRPYKTEFNAACIWTAWSPDLVSWGDHDMTLAPRPGTWTSERVGAGAPPIRTEEGWLEVFHGCDENRRYCLGAMLSDLHQPQRVIACSTRPVLEPLEPYETTGVFDNVVFSNGLVVDDDGRLIVYYGAGDGVCAAATSSVDEMIAAAKS